MRTTGVIQLTRRRLDLAAAIAALAFVTETGVFPGRTVPWFGNWSSARKSGKPSVLAVVRRLLPAARLDPAGCPD